MPHFSSDGIDIAFIDEGSGERLVQLTFYGDRLTDTPATAFALGRPLQVYDTAGRVELAYDFRGRTTSQVRRVFTDITTEADWDGLEAETALAAIGAWLGTNGTLDAETSQWPVRTTRWIGSPSRPHPTARRPSRATTSGAGSLRSMCTSGVRAPRRRS